MRFHPAFAFALVFASIAVAAASSPVLFAGGSWVAIDRGSSCVALTRSQRIATQNAVQATAGFAFTPDRRRLGEFHAHLSRMPRPGTSAILRVGGQPFLLVARGDWAWSSGARQEQAVIAAARNSGSMTVESRDSAGRRFVDSYLLDGAPTAIDAAAARCALRGAGKIR